MAPKTTVAYDASLSEGSALGLRLRGADDLVEVVLGDRLAVAWMLPNAAGQWIMHRTEGRLGRVELSGQEIVLSTKSGSHRVPVSGIVGLSLDRMFDDRARRMRAGWIGGGVVAASVAVVVAGGLASFGLDFDEVPAFIALITSPLTIPAGAGLGSIASAAFFEGRPVRPTYLIDHGHYQIEVVQP